MFPLPSSNTKPKLPRPPSRLTLLASLLLTILSLANIAARPNFPPAEHYAVSGPSFIPTPALVRTPAAPQVQNSTFSPSTADSLPAPDILEVAAPDSEPTLPSDAPTGSKIEHVVIISIDGLRPDALSLADTPNLDKLIERGAYCPHSQTVSLSLTLPSHASMLSGTIPEKHGIVWGIPYIGWPGMNGPTLFNITREAGLRSAMVFGKDKLNYLVLPNSVDQVFGADAHDPQIRDWALEIIQAGLPHVLFIHFPDTDRVGHEYGWMSENQFFAITYVDNLVGEIVAELDGEGYLNQTLLIVTADHGGKDHAHGDDSAIDRTIPWLAVGPSIKSGVTLSSPVYTYDTAATVLYALGLQVPEHWEGRPVVEIFEPATALVEVPGN